ncbi:MAG: SDR family oxidoreductase [archaeon]|nr:SDR family oxidoreductase [archaeon]MCP8312860.1 SDR family oxidoreductase [archaeon]MCP8316768.1 SDR family oxidoreductase [archaeon]MCP8321062.1 SDR family oxidoreductase [archaeon]
MLDKIVEEDVKRICEEIIQDKFKGKSILITGGAGFIGSWLCDVLFRLRANVTCIDNLSTGKHENIDHLLGKKGFKFFQEDVVDFKTNEKYDFILHLASRASPEEYQKHPIETLLANSFGTYHMLEMARKSGSIILYTSTSEVYGDAKVIPTPENYWGNVNPVGLRSPYDEGKRFGEALMMAYFREYGLDTRIVRIFNTYGPRLRADGHYARAISRFILQALSGKDITVYGDGSQTRSFCYISDIIRGILLALIKEGARGEVINIGNPQEMSILDLAKRIREMTKSNSSIIFQSLPEDDPKRRCPNITKAKEILGWEPKIGLDEGLKKTINWFRYNLKINI